MQLTLMVTSILMVAILISHVDHLLIAMGRPFIMGGTVIVNGETVTDLTSSQMGDKRHP